MKRARLQPGQYAKLSGMDNSGEGSGSETESSQTTPEPSSSQTIPEQPTPPTTPPDGQTPSSQTTTTPPSGQTSSSETTEKVRKTMHGWMDSVVQELMIVGVKSNAMMRVINQFIIASGVDKKLVGQTTIRRKMAEILEKKRKERKKKQLFFLGVDGRCDFTLTEKNQYIKVMSMSFYPDLITILLQVYQNYPHKIRIKSG